jgi:hypothetical protein
MLDPNLKNLIIKQMKSCLFELEREHCLATVALTDAVGLLAEMKAQLKHLKKRET